LKRWGVLHNREITGRSGVGICQKSGFGKGFQRGTSAGLTSNRELNGTSAATSEPARRVVKLKSAGREELRDHRDGAKQKIHHGKLQKKTGWGRRSASTGRRKKRDASREVSYHHRGVMVSDYDRREG